LVGLWEETCKEQSVSELPTQVVHLQRLLLQFLEQRCGSITTRLKGSEFNPLLASLFLLQGTFSLTAKGTTSHFDLSFFPVDLGVVVLELVIA